MSSVENFNEYRQRMNDVILSEANKVFKHFVSHEAMLREVYCISFTWKEFVFNPLGIWDQLTVMPSMDKPVQIT